MKNLRADTLLRNGMLVFAAQMIVNVSNFGFHFLVSRKVGVVAYGTLNALVSGFQILVVPSVIVTTVLVKYAAEFKVRCEEGRLKRLLSASTRVLLAGAAAVFLAGILLSGTVSAFFHMHDRLPIVLMVAILCFNFVLPIRGIMQGQEHFKPYAISLVLEAVLKVAAAALFIWLGWGIAGALGGWTAGCALALAYTWFAQWLPARGVVKQRTDLNVREILATSGGVALAMVCVNSLGFSDVVLAKHFFSPVEAGLYGAAALCGKMLYFLVYFVPAVVLPRVASESAQGKPTAKILFGALSVVGVLGGAGAIFFRFFGGLVVQTLAGHAFAAAAPMVFPYAFAAILFAAVNTAVTYMIGAGRYGFIVPLLGLALVQIGAISVFHASVMQMIAVLIATNLAALLAVVIPFGAAKVSAPSILSVSQRSASYD